MQHMPKMKAKRSQMINIKIQPKSKRTKLIMVLATAKRRKEHITTEYRARQRILKF